MAGNKYSESELSEDSYVDEDVSEDPSESVIKIKFSQNSDNDNPRHASGSGQTGASVSANVNSNVVLPKRVGNVHNSFPSKVESFTSDSRDNSPNEELLKDPILASHGSHDIHNMDDITKILETDSHQPLPTTIHHNNHNQNENQSENGNPRENFNQILTTKATGMSVRCHCNLASCVTNNYMCKSERLVTETGKILEAGCFVEELEGDSPSTASSSSSSSSKSSSPSSSSSSSSSSSKHAVSMWNGRIATARRGCVESLTREKREQCSDKTGNPIECCTQDMCNYPKSFYPSSVQQNNFNSNRVSFDSSSSVGGIRSSHGHGSGYGHGHGQGNGAGMMPNLDHQVWLRAAVIAVPICGLMILVVLIIVARRLLKSDEDFKDPDGHGRRNRRKIPANYHYHHQQNQTQNHNHNLPHHLSFQSNNPRGISYGPDTGFHVKPVYMETSEYLLPQEDQVHNHHCSHCRETDNSTSNSHPRSSSSSSNFNYPGGNGEGNTGFNFGFRKSTNRNSETEELVNSRSSNSSSGNSSQTCSSCSGHGVNCDPGSDGRHSFCTGDPDEDQDQMTPTPTSANNFLSSSFRRPALFSGSSPELPAAHRQNKRFSFLSRIGLSRSTECQTNAFNSRPFHV